MKPLIRRLLLLGTLVLLLSPWLSQVLAQGTAFTYQGRLNDGGQPANGIYDLQFSLYDTAGGGTGGTGPIIAGPLTNSATDISNGLFTVVLDFGNGVFTGLPRWLQIGVRTNGSSAFTELMPRTLVTAAPYAITASQLSGTVSLAQLPANVALLNANQTFSGSNLFGGAVSMNNPANTLVGSHIGDGSGLTNLSGTAIASNSISGAQLAAGAAAANLNASGQSGVPSGGLVLSSGVNYASLLAAGYVKLGAIPLGEVWQRVGTGGTAPAQNDFTEGVWSGSEMLIYGPGNYSGRYNPQSDIWTKVGTDVPPGNVYNASVVWSGSEMIVWGGFIYGYYFNTGGRYNPATGNWTAVTTSNAPSARAHHTAVWTGTKMIVWGGVASNSIALNDGGIYDPSSDSWAPMSQLGAPPSARYDHTAVWTGSQMIVWGGRDNGLGGLNTGGVFDLATRLWTTMTTLSAPATRASHSAVWTGSEMIIWGGYGGDVISIGISKYFSGARYNPSANTWTNISTANASSGTYQHTALWTGSAMFVWGGAYTNRTINLTNYVFYTNSGALYSPATDKWTPISSIGAPTVRGGPAAVWTGNQVILWGGYDGTNYLADTFSYTPASTFYLYQRP
jgi:N-acetylneuraminic acid mutarotase